MIDREEIEAKLQHEIEIGRKATHAYESYFRDYYIAKTNELFERFKVSSELEMLGVQGVLVALNELNNDILNKIETSELAAKQLRDDYGK